MSASAAGDADQVAEDQCRICQLEAYLNPNMRLMVSHCGHRYCETCIKRHFINHPTLNCAAQSCGQKLTKNSFVPDSQYERLFDKETKVRKKILALYNKPRSEFPSTRAYNDYLEQIEDIIYSLVSDVNSEATRAQIDEYRRKNEAAIAVNQAKKEAEAAELTRKIQQEKDEAEAKHKAADEKFAAEDAKYAYLRRQVRGKPQHATGTTTTAAATSSAAPAAATMSSAAPPASKPSAPSYVPAAVAATAKAPVFVQPQPLFALKPDGPPDAAAAAKAAGYSESFARKRCLEEALSSLSITPRPT